VPSATSDARQRTPTGREPDITADADQVAVDQIERGLIALARRVTDPRGNRAINELAGADIERAGATMLARLEEIQPARLSEMACAAGVEISTASRQVARLVELGFIERSSDPDDKRASVHRLSPAGVETRHRLREARRTWIDKIVVDLDAEERRQFGSLFDRVIDRMVAVDADDNES
jgi:DNA-binding MarR family transcriptional regulator